MTKTEKNIIFFDVVTTVKESSFVLKKARNQYRNKEIDKWRRTRILLACMRTRSLIVALGSESMYSQYQDNDNLSRSTRNMKKIKSHLSPKFYRSEKRPCKSGVNIQERNQNTSISHFRLTTHFPSRIHHDVLNLRLKKMRLLIIHIFFCTVMTFR